jgi:ATP-dependent DNA helicase RecG
MRPPLLFPLFATLRSLPGVGARFGPALERLAGPRVIDLLWHLPTSAIARGQPILLAAAEPGQIVTLRLYVEDHRPPRGARRPYRVLCLDEAGDAVTLTFFHAREAWLTSALPPGQWRLVSGLLQAYGAERQMAHPDYIASDAEAARIPAVEPVYPLTQGIGPRLLTRWLAAALQRLPELPEWLDTALLGRMRWPSWREALHAVHQPASVDDGAMTAPARQRLAYDELLANQLALAVTRAGLHCEPGRAIPPSTRLRGAVLAALPYALTPAQVAVLAEIDQDMGKPQPMLRLLQGDVGSGKTVVALLVMLNAVEHGAQAVLMAPTELLARQHAATLARLAAPAGLGVALLTGREKAGARAVILDALAVGAAPLIVGTHALFQEGVAFRDLGLVVIDEQHRFGVHQRLALAAKGSSPDILVLTATPIPRTLMLAAYGDLDSSRLTEKPPGRTPVLTRAIPLERLEEVVAAVGRAVAAGARVYWICPLVSPSEAVDLAAAEERAGALRQRFGAAVGLIHGRMPAAAKEATMAAFLDGPISILVATTVIEVGVDVPAATIMVIEHAERFGLAQLHQLRGRVGRGEASSHCILLYASPLNETARARLSILRETDDGFRIAEEDLRLRGPGELLGVRQSGLPGFRLADLAVHADLLPVAADDARLILSRDPDLASVRGQALRLLLHLFEREQAVRYLRSG